MALTLASSRISVMMVMILGLFSLPCNSAPVRAGASTPTATSGPTDLPRTDIYHQYLFLFSTPFYSSPPPPPNQTYSSCMLVTNNQDLFLCFFHFLLFDVIDLTVMTRVRNVTIAELNAALENQTITVNITYVRALNVTFNDSLACAFFDLVLLSANSNKKTYEPTQFIQIFNKVMSYLVSVSENRFNTTLSGPLAFPNATPGPRTDGIASLCITQLHYEPSWVLYVILGCITAVALLVTIILVFSLGRDGFYNTTYLPVDDNL